GVTSRVSVREADRSDQSKALVCVRNAGKTRLCGDRFIHYNPPAERPASSGPLVERAVTNPRNTQVVIGPNASMDTRMAVTFMV
ncbi:hypothetical protein, partial [Escherichia coli]|uniref:hypothetical protein n=1 Tax=Escherichia coli TaxID=562 RepID=UPI00215A0DF3